jgi:hypothetical protein
MMFVGCIGDRRNALAAVLALACLFQDRQHLIQHSLDNNDAHVRCFLICGGTG